MFKIDKLNLVLFYILIKLIRFNCYVYDACELANELVQTHEIPSDEIADWVCSSNIKRKIIFKIDFFLCFKNRFV